MRAAFRWVSLAGSIAFFAPSIQASLIRSPESLSSFRPDAHVRDAALEPAPFVVGDSIDFPGCAKEFLAKHKLADAKPESTTMATLLDGPTYVRLDLGAFDLRYPVAHLKDKGHADDFRDICQALFSYQAKWLEWSSPKHARFKEAMTDIATLQKWVKGWSGGALGSADRGEDRDLVVILKAKEPVVEAAKRFGELMRSGEMLGLKLTGTDGAQIAFAPDRKDYLGMVGFVGWVDPVARNYFWHNGQINWTTIWHGVTQVVALEYPAWPADLAHPDRGASMNEFEKTGLLQHVLQRASQSLFWHYFGINDALFFEAGNATNLVIAVLGENNIRIGGAVTKNSGNTTLPYERFVPGGNPGGGTLPPNSAAAGDIKEIPIWRTTVGRDYFVKPLRQAQAAGFSEAAKDRAKDKTAHFLLTAKEKGQRRAVSAPFLGKPAEGKRLPSNEFLDDYEDFFRAYTAGFYHWLQTVGGGKTPQAAAEKYTELIQKVATRDPNKSFSDVVEEVYGEPLSLPDGEKPSLEWRFLAWLAKS